jgi:hypothetical protein
MREIPWHSEELLASQESLCTVITLLLRLLIQGRDAAKHSWSLEKTCSMKTEASDSCDTLSLYQAKDVKSPKVIIFQRIDLRISDLAQC